MSKVRKLTVLCVIISIMAVSFMTNFAFAASSKGITDPFPSSKIFYSNSQVNCIYTNYDQLNFRFYGNVDYNRTFAFVRMETKLGSGEYLPWEAGNLESWSAGVWTGSKYVGTTYKRLTFPKEGRYQVQLFYFNENTGTYDIQEFTVVYKKNMTLGDYKKSMRVVHKAEVTDFRYVNGEAKATVTARVHDLSEQGINGLKIGLSNLEIMRISRGGASSYWADDIKVTRDSVNPDEYIVTATVNAGFYNNRPGEYYVRFNMSNYEAPVTWDDMFRRIFLN